MKSRILSGIVVSAILTIASGAAFPARAAFSHKVAKVVVGYDANRSTLANFPVLVRVPTATASECRADGADMRFTSADGKTVYPHEIDAWNPSGESTVWVLLPEMKNGTSFVMEWGDADYTGPETPLAKGAVWDPAGYAGVWHMTEASGNVANATSKTGVNGASLDAIPSGARAAYSVRSGDAPIGYARDTGAQDVNHDSNGRAFLRVPNYDNLELGNTFTISGWWKITDYHGNYDRDHRTRNGRMFSRKTSWNMNGGFEFALNNSSTVASIAGGASDNNAPKVGMSGFADSYNNWVHMAFVYNGSTTTAFVNGVQKASGTISPATDCGLDLGIGSNVGNSNGVYNNDSYVVGLFDEMRLQSLRSDVAYADWFAAEYAMGANPAFLEDQAISQTTPVISIAITSDTAREWRNESPTITLSRSSDSAWSTITVNLSWEGTTSLVSGMPQSITMQTGETSSTIEIPVVDNSETDGDRSLTVTVLPGTGYEVGSSAAVSLTVIDDETHTATCSWTGLGDGSSWGDPMNWSSESVPTEIDPVVFGDGVSAGLVVALPTEGAASAKSILVTSAAAFTIGTAEGSALAALPFEIASGAGLVTINAEFNLASDVELMLAADTELDIRRIVGTGNFVVDGAGTVKFLADSNRTGGETEVKGGVLLISGSRQLGSKLTIGGAGKTAVARSNGASYGTVPFDDNNQTIVLDKGVYDLETDGLSDHWQKEKNGPITVSKGGLFLPGKRRIQIATAGVPVLTIEGAVSGGQGAAINLYDNSSLVVPATADVAPNLSFGMTITQNVRFDIADIPDAPIDATISGGIAFGWASRDAFWKLGSGVLRLTGNNTYGGGGQFSSGEGTTQVREGSLLVDNDPTVYGSGTGNSIVRVDGGALLGGTGRIGGLTEEVKTWSGTGNGENTRVTAKGTAGKQAVVWPGTIDGEDGSHVNGTLSVGVAELHHPVTFGDYSTFKASFGAARNDQDALVVNGAVDISKTGTKLVLVTNCVPGNVRGGTYTILSATDGITNSFAEVEKPSGWRVNKVNARQVAVGEGETTVEVYDALTVTMAGRGFAVFIR